MADFKQALQLVLQYEGGYVNDPQDPGGETYKGVARNMNSSWDGWVIIDLLKKQPGFPASLTKNTELSAEIEQFYKALYWDRLKGDHITDQRVANAIFDFGVNAGTSTSAVLAQKVVDAKEDGVIGNETIKAINAMPPDQFIAFFTIAKIARYLKIVKNRPTSKKYFYGWIRRALGEH